MDLQPDDPMKMLQDLSQDCFRLDACYRWRQVRPDSKGFLHRQAVAAWERAGKLSFKLAQWAAMEGMAAEGALLADLYAEVEERCPPALPEHASERREAPDFRALALAVSKARMGLVMIQARLAGKISEPPPKKAGRPRKNKERDSYIAKLWNSSEKATWASVSRTVNKDFPGTTPLVVKGVLERARQRGEAVRDASKAGNGRHEITE